MREQLTPLQLKEKYNELNDNKVDKASLRKLKENLTKLEKETNRNHTPIIDIRKLIIIEYQKVFGWIDKRFKKFIFKGSRGSAKTTFAVQFIIINMLLDNQSSWFVIMENKVQHSDSTMLEFKTWIDIIDTMWSGFASKWEKSDGQSIKEWRFRHNGSYQKVKFIGLEECSKGTITPPSKNYWRGYWIEEVVSSNEQFGSDMEKKAEKLSVINTLKGSTLRFFNRCKDEEKKKTLRFLELWTFNPYNDEDPALENFNKYHPDNEEELRKYGFTWKENREDDEVYITSNYLVNNHLPEEFIEYMKELERKKVGAWKTLVYGMTGSPINTVFSNIFHIMDNQQRTINFKNFISNGYVGFKKFFITIDIGNGGEGQTAMILWGHHLNGKDIPLKEFGTRKYENDNGYDVEKVILLLWDEITKWTKHFSDIKEKSIIPILIDYDKTWKILFEKGYSSFKGKGMFKIKMFNEKYKTAFKQEKRPAIVRNLITTNQILVSKELTPQLWKELRNLKTTKLGKLQEQGIDFWDSFNHRIFHKAKEVSLHNLQTNKVLDKDMQEFITNIR